MKNKSYKNPEYLNLIKKLAGKKILFRESNILDDLFVDLGDIDIQLILRDTDLDTLVKALAGASGKVLLQVYRNMGDRGALILNEDVEEYFKNYKLNEIIFSQNKIVETYEKLQNSGEIKNYL